METGHTLNARWLALYRACADEFAQPCTSVLGSHQTVCGGICRAQRIKGSGFNRRSRQCTIRMQLMHYSNRPRMTCVMFPHSDSHSGRDDPG